MEPVLLSLWAALAARAAYRVFSLGPVVPVPAALLVLSAERGLRVGDQRSVLGSPAFAHPYVEQVFFDVVPQPGLGQARALHEPRRTRRRGARCLWDIERLFPTCGWFVSHMGAFRRLLSTLNQVDAALSPGWWAFFELLFQGGIGWLFPDLRGVAAYFHIGRPILGFSVPMECAEWGVFLQPSLSSWLVDSRPFI